MQQPSKRLVKNLYDFFFYLFERVVINYKFTSSIRILAPFLFSHTTGLLIIYFHTVTGLRRRLMSSDSAEKEGFCC